MAQNVRQLETETHICYAGKWHQIVSKKLRFFSKVGEPLADAKVPTRPQLRRSFWREKNGGKRVCEAGHPS